MAEISSLISSAATSLSGQLETGRNAGSETLEFPINLESFKRPIIRFVCLPHDPSLPIESICMPCPGGVTFTDSATYATVDMGTISGAAEIASAFAKGGDTVKDKLKAAAAEGGAQAASGGGIGASILLTKKLGLEKTSQALELSGKQVVNPRTNTTFSGNVLRNFQFDFSLVGSNEAEVRMIDRIQNVFRYNVYASELGQRKTMLQYPPLWHIEFLSPEMVELEYMPKIFSCYLTNVAVSVNSESNTWRKDLSPYQINVSLSFQESKVLTRNEIEDLEQNSNRDNRDLAIIEEAVEDFKSAQTDALNKLAEEEAEANNETETD